MNEEAFSKMVKHIVAGRSHSIAEVMECIDEVAGEDAGIRDELGEFFMNETWLVKSLPLLEPKV